MGCFDHAGSDFTRPGGRKRDALRSFAVHAECQRLDVQNDIGDVFTHTGNGREFMQNPVNLNSRNSCALQRGQKDTTQRIAERGRETTF